MSDKRKTYTIGTKTFFQEQITPGQIKQLKNALSDSGVQFDQIFHASDVVMALADKAALVACILICEEGTDLENKIPVELEKELEFKMSLEQTTQIVQDFFLLTPLTSIWKQIQETLQTLIKANFNSLKEIRENLEAAEKELIQDKQNQ